MTEKRKRNKLDTAMRSFVCVLSRSLVEPTSCVPRWSPWQQFSPQCKICLGGRPGTEWRASRTTWCEAEVLAMFLRRGENCHHGGRLVTQELIHSSSGAKA